MKIGILTLPLHNNYGGNLQAYSLMVYLRKIGGSPVLMRFAPLSKTCLEKIKMAIGQLVHKYIFQNKTIQAQPQYPIYCNTIYKFPGSSVFL